MTMMIVMMTRRITIHITSQVPIGDYEVTLGKARIVRKGSDVTLVGWGAQVNVLSKVIVIMMMVVMMMMMVIVGDDDDDDDDDGSGDNDDDVMAIIIMMMLIIV